MVRGMIGRDEGIFVKTMIGFKESRAKVILWVELSYWAWVPIIGAFIKNWYVMRKGYLVSQERVRSESYP